MPDWIFLRFNYRCFLLVIGIAPIVHANSVSLGISTMAFNLNGFNFNQSVVDSQGRVITFLSVYFF
jgi:photosystem II P680 reaction center D1 protein